MHFHVLGSSSSGNSGLLITPESKILIDAGFSAKKLQGFLEELGHSLDSIDGVFITHEHSDHIAGLRGLARKSHLKFFANRQTAHILQEKLTTPLKWHLFETGSRFEHADLSVEAFSIPHDAHDPVGFTFRYRSESEAEHQSFAWATDLGYLPKLVQEKIRNVDILVIESNYDVDLLDNDPKRPWSLKQRIKGRHGHLSNDETFEFISNTPNPQWKKIFLAHLSRDCNDIARIRSLYEPHLKKNPQLEITIVDPDPSAVSIATS